MQGHFTNVVFNLLLFSDGKVRSEKQISSSIRINNAMASYRHEGCGSHSDGQPAWERRALFRVWKHWMATKVQASCWAKAGRKPRCGILKHDPQPPIPGPSCKQWTGRDLAIQRPFISGKASFTYSLLQSINRHHATTRTPSRENTSTCMRPSHDNVLASFW